MIRSDSNRTIPSIHVSLEPRGNIHVVLRSSSDSSLVNSNAERYSTIGRSPGVEQGPRDLVKVQHIHFKPNEIGQNPSLTAELSHNNPEQALANVGYSGMLRV
jgi:hypothetical protein